MPDDPMNRCAVSVHYYTPASFAILEEDADWGKAISTWGTEADFAELYQQMDMMKTTFIDKGIPVIIGEYGCPIKNKEPDSVRLFLSSVCKEAYERQLCPIMWDITGIQYNRDTCELNDKELKELLMAIPEKSESVKYDINNDGKFSIADLVNLNTWIIRSGELKNSSAADLNNDGEIDSFDLVLLRQEFVKQL